MESKYFIRKINCSGKIFVSIIIIVLSIVFQYMIIKNYDKNNNSENLYIEEQKNSFVDYFVIETKDDFNKFTIVNTVFFSIGSIALIISIVIGLKNRRDLSKYDKKGIMKDIDKRDTIINHDGKLYLTDKYILSYKSKIDIIDYEDVVWIYPNTKNNMGTTTSFITVFDTSGKNHYIFYIQSDEKINTEFNEMYVNLRNKLPHSLYGYTAENKEKAQAVVNRYTGKK